MTHNANKAHLLYVAGDHELARLLKKKLVVDGYAVTLVHEGATAIQQCMETRFDLLAVDHDHADRDGLEIIRSLCASERLPPALIFAAPGEEEIVIEAMRMGAQDYVLRDDTGRYLDLVPVVIEKTLGRQRLVNERQGILQHVQHANRSLGQLNKVGRALTSNHDLSEIIDHLLAALVDIVNADGSSVWLWDENEDELVCNAVFHRSQVPALLNLRLKSGEGVAGWVAEHGEPAIVRHTHADDRFKSAIDTQSGFHTVSLLAVPIRLPNKILGVIEAVNKRTGNFDDDDLSFAETLAAWAAIAIDNARLVNELREHSKALEKKNRALDKFGHTVAHDLKNPLSLLVGFSELLNSDWDRLSEEERRRCMDGILNNIYKMENIIEELLTLAGLRESNISLIPLDMRQILYDVQTQLAHMISRYGATIDVGENWPAALGYGPWVEQIWTNYISNAIKYGGTPPHIILSAAEAPDGMVEFSVRDNGPGISAEKQEQLFRPFTQLEQAPGGHGLGLSIVRQIVERLGGTVGMSSTLGEGSEFTFTLPAVRTSSGSLQQQI